VNRKGINEWNGENINTNNRKVKHGEYKSIEKKTRSWGIAS
jgi:hypothetical protein